MAFGLGVLRLSSREFWALTPRELDAALRGVLGPSPDPGNAAPALQDVLSLMEAFPDEDRPA